MSDYYDNDTRIADVKERFEKQKHFQLPPIEGKHSHGKEFQFFLRWSGDGGKIVNYKTDYYNGHVYYLDMGYLFQSNEDGSEKKILIKISEHFKVDIAVSVTMSNVFISVNSSGIYLYQHSKDLLICQFTLEGEFVKKLFVKGYTSQVYIAEGLIYYVVDKTASKQAACYVNITGGPATTILEATKILELYGNTEKAVVKAAYEKTKSGILIHDDGWYLHTIATKNTACISSEACPPNTVFSCPDAYIVGNPKYIDFKDAITIRCIDIVRDIMWIATPLIEKLDVGVRSQEYWEPMQLALEGAPITDAPIWCLTNHQFSAGNKDKHVNEASYFDGTCFLNGRGLYVMKSFDVEGKSKSYGESTERGACNNFRVLHGHVYADFDGKGWEQYKLNNTELIFERPCWFGLQSGVADGVKKLVKEFNSK